MRKFYNSILSPILVLFALTSCTQSPAQVALKGQESYTKNAVRTGSGSSFLPISSAPSMPANIPQNTVQAAEYNSVGVSDLAPPTKTTLAQKKTSELAKPAEKSLDKPTENSQKLAEKPTEKPTQNLTEKPIEKANINSWTNKPRSDNEQKPTGTGEFEWPVESRKIISSFGDKGAGKANDGVNIATSDGETVLAAADGEVVYVGSDLAGYGNMVIIKHENNKSTSYGHLGRVSVDKYARVKKGDMIGSAGATGSVKTPQLFFSLRVNGSPVDPTKYMGG